MNPREAWRGATGLYEGTTCQAGEASYVVILLFGPKRPFFSPRLLLLERGAQDLSRTARQRRTSGLCLTEHHPGGGNVARQPPPPFGPVKLAGTSRGAAAHIPAERPSAPKIEPEIEPALDPDPVCNQALKAKGFVALPVKQSA